MILNADFGSAYFKKRQKVYVPQELELYNIDSGVFKKNVHEVNQCIHQLCKNVEVCLDRR